MANTTIFWGYGLYTDALGDYVKKPMRECSGEEILMELIHHLHFEENTKDIMESVVNVIPCMMPYIDSQFQPRAMSDRPLVIPSGSTNFAMISQLWRFRRIWYSRRNILYAQHVWQFTDCLVLRRSCAR